uniref:Uncharacterized protein n=1 Tax=Biomphalaria glabrata TaxID=6526 RepID=A0A2C9L8R8_BIOGL
MSRANSLKKAVRQIIEHTERAVDEQNAQTLEMENCNFRGSAMLKANEASRSAPSFSVFLEEDLPPTVAKYESIPQPQGELLLYDAISEGNCVNSKDELLHVYITYYTYF